MYTSRLSGPSLWLVLAGCIGLEPLNDAADGDHAAFVRETPDAASHTGDAHGSMCDTDATLLRMINEPTTSVGVLQVVGVHARAAQAITAWRDGDDTAPGTVDDRTFGSLDEVDAVYGVGPVAMGQLQGHGSRLCPSVVMSPSAYDDSHIAMAIDAVEKATSSVDIAMYSFRDAGMMDALAGAAGRGIEIRMLYHGAAEDRKDPAGTRSADLEDLGIEVRWINKIMHHKFALIDGPHAHPYQAWRATLVTGSGNWSWSAATVYDENTTAITGDARLNLAFQREFNHLWDNARLVEWNETIQPIAVIEITETDVAAAPGADVWLTSANFRTYESERYGPTFSHIRGERGVVDRIVALIESAEKSVDIASGHLRFRPIYAALIAKQSADSDIAIRVYLDAQEYSSSSYFEYENEDYVDCMDAATGSEDARACEDFGAHFGYPLHAAGIPLRYKSYSYRWHYLTAVQMHHKYVLIDGHSLVSGSYNISANAEYDTIENAVLYTADRYPSVVAAFQDNMNSIWETGLADEAFAAHIARIESADESGVALLFDPMALDWDQVGTLRDAIRTACPDVDSTAYRDDPTRTMGCDD